MRCFFSIVRKLLLILLLLPAALRAEVDVPDSLRSILGSDAIVAEERFRLSYNLIFYNSPPEQAEQLGQRVLWPFVQATWGERAAQLAHRARLELLVSFCFRERGGELADRGERLWMERAVGTAEEAGGDTIRARCYTAAGFMEMKRGQARRAHEYLYAAIGCYERMEQWSMASQMLYVIASHFHEIRDAQGLERVLAQMEANLRRDDSAQSRYQYNVIRAACYELLIEGQASPDTALIEQAMRAIRGNVALVETRLAELDSAWMHGYAYYYLAKALHDHDAAKVDSIFIHLAQAEAMLEREEISRLNENASEKELRIHIDVLRAQTLLGEGARAEALATMHRAIALLDGLDDHENLNRMRSEAYGFMADYYERVDPAEALRYHKLLAANEARRYETQKLQAINEMAARYESEKQQLQIDALEVQNRSARRILWLIVSLALAGLGALALLIRQVHLRHRNTEQRLYQTALEAELRQSELDALRSPDRLTPIRRAIEKIEGQVAAARIDAKDDYLARLRALDPAALERDWRAAAGRLTAMELKYLICFRIEMATADIAALMNIEPASVHTVRYRIRKKFPR